MSFENNLKRAFRTDFTNNKPSDKDFDSIFNNITTELGYKPKFRISLKKIIPLAEAALVALLIVCIPYLGVQPHYSNMPAIQYNDGSGDSAASAVRAANPAKESTSQVKNKNASITLINKPGYFEYTKKCRSFTTEPVVVEKSNTTGEMFFEVHSMNDHGDSYNLLKDGFMHATVYQDDKPIYEITFKDSNSQITLPYKITKDKSTFKIKIKCTKNIKNDDLLCFITTWWVNETLENYVDGSWK